MGKAPQAAHQKPSATPKPSSALAQKTTEPKPAASKPASSARPAQASQRDTLAGAKPATGSASQRKPSAAAQPASAAAGTAKAPLAAKSAAAKPAAPEKVSADRFFMATPDTEAHACVQPKWPVDCSSVQGWQPICEIGLALDSNCLPTAEVCPWSFWRSRSARGRQSSWGQQRTAFGT